MVYRIQREGSRTNGLIYDTDADVIVRLNNKSQKLISNTVRDYGYQIVFNSKRRGFTGHNSVNKGYLIVASFEEEQQAQAIISALNKCHHCKKLCEEDLNDDGLCSKCVEKNVRKCEHCGKFEQNGYTLITSNPLGMYVCRSCVTLLIPEAGGRVVCHSCDNWFHKDFVYLRHLNGRCPTCNECNHNVLGYRDNPELKFKPHTEPKYDNLYFGFELEVDKAGTYSSNSIQIGKIVGDDVFFKRDGSLNRGFEIVSQPMHYEYFMDKKETYAKMFNKAIEMGYRSHKTATCGLHFHVSKQAYTDTEIVKLIYLFEKHWDNITVFTRRAPAKLSRWANRYGVGHQNDIERNEIDKKPEQSKEKLQSLRCRGRYSAVNLVNANTVEFRVFRGTLNINTFVASMQFIRHLTDMVKQYDIDALRAMTWSELMKSDFEELNQYLVLRGIDEDIFKTPKNVVDK